MEPVDRTSESLRGLVSDLDRKLAAQRAGDEAITILPDDERQIRRAPVWVACLVVVALGLGTGSLVVRPWQPRCEYGHDLCQIAELDIDAVRITIPESELIAQLPKIEALDPQDELTVGEIFAMDRFQDLHFPELLTDQEVERLLAVLG